MAAKKTGRDSRGKPKPAPEETTNLPILPLDFDSLLKRIPKFEEASVLTNGLFVQIVREVFMPLFSQVGELASVVSQLRAENTNILAELRKQQVELQMLREQLTVTTTMSYVPARASAATNVLIHGVPEVANETAHDLRRDALSYLRALNTTPTVLARDVLSVSRLGLVAKDGRQRPLIVKFKDTSLPSVLAKASYIAYQSNKAKQQHQPYVTRHIIRQQHIRDTRVTTTGFHLGGTQMCDGSNKLVRSSEPSDITASNVA